MIRPKLKAPQFGSAWEALRAHGLLYVYEGAELATFMVAACAASVLLFHTGAHLNPWLARVGMGFAMGGTAVGIILSPAGKASGAQFNPAISLTFYRLGKIGPYDTVFYCVSHFVGAIAGVGLSVAAFGRVRLAEPNVHYITTVPGLGGVWGAFAAEFGMSAVLIVVVMFCSSREKLKRWTPWIMGTLIWSYVILLAPVSGFSMNPARTVGSSVWADVWTAVWVYFVAPVAGMLGGAEVYLRAQKDERVMEQVRGYLRHRHVVQREERGDV